MVRVWKFMAAGTFTALGFCTHPMMGVGALIYFVGLTLWEVDNGKF